MRIEKGNIRLSEDFYDNYLSIKGEDFLLEYLDPNKPYNKGASSNIFLLKDPTEETEDRVIKVCKTPRLPRTRDKSIKRFEREIQAFKLVKKNGLNGIIKYFDDGLLTINRENYLYIILEKAESDLSSYLTDNKFEFTNNQRLSFCVNILNNLKQLHDIGIYHRDIKHDNILCVDGEFKIGDLGLVKFQNRDFQIDRPNEKIGPVGWLSPEATNKMLSDNKCYFAYDCEIDSKSDIFQLGKLFWYIFQGNLPVGQLQSADNNFEDEEIFDVIFSMLQYNKERRPTIPLINARIEPIRQRLIV